MSQSEAARRVYGNLELGLAGREVLVEGRRVDLTNREFEILLLLGERLDSVVTREDIYARVWGGRRRYRDRSVDAAIRKIRSKLLAVAPDWCYVHTHFGFGYRFAPERRRRAREGRE